MNCRKILSNMDDLQTDQALSRFICQTSGLDERRANRIITEVLAFYTETVNDFVRRRHAELKNETDMRNADIFRVIAKEIETRPFRAEPVSERQVRRIIYG